MSKVLRKKEIAFPNKDSYVFLILFSYINEDKLHFDLDKVSCITAMRLASHDARIIVSLRCKRCKSQTKSITVF